MPNLSIPEKFWPTAVLCLFFVSQLWLEQQDVTIEGWPRLLVRTLALIAGVVLMQLRGLELPLPTMPPFLARPQTPPAAPAR